MDKLLSAATVGETADVSSNVSTAITKSAIDDEYLNSENETLKSNADTMVMGMSKIKGKELTEAIELADTHRDNLLVALINFIKGYLSWKKEATVNAAKLIMAILKAHGNNFSRLSNEEESANYDSLLVEFEKEENVAAIATLGLTELHADMKNAEIGFKNLYQQSAEIESSKTVAIAPSAIKRNTQIKLNDIINYLKNMSKAKPTVYGALTANVTELVYNLNNKIRKRININKGDEDDLKIDDN